MLVFFSAPNEDSVAQKQTKIQDNSEVKKPVNAGSSPSQSSSVSSQVQMSLSSKQSSVHSPGVGDKKSLLSEYKNKVLTRGGVPSKSQLPSRKTGELELSLQSTEVTEDHNSSEEAPVTLPKAQDHRRIARPLSSSRTIHPVLASGRTPVRTHTSEVSRQTSTEKREPSAMSPSSAQRSSASSVPKNSDNETKQLRQSNTNVPSPKASSHSLPANMEEKPNPLLVKVPSKTSEPGLLGLPSNRQSVVTHEVDPSHPSVSLPKKTFSSHLPSQKTQKSSHSEPLQKVQTSPSLLHSRGRRLPSPVSSQSNEELQEDNDEDVTEDSDRASSRSVFPKELSTSRGLPTSFSQGSSSSSLSKQQQPGSQVPSYKSVLSQPDSSSASGKAKDNQYNSKLSSTSSRQTRPSLASQSRAATRIVSHTEKKYDLLPSKMSQTELPRKVPSSSSSKSRQSVSDEEDDYNSEYDQKEMEEKPTSLAAKWSPSLSRGNKNTYDDTASNKRKSMDTLLPHKLGSEEEEKEETPTLKISSPESPGSSAVASRIIHSSNKHTPSKPSFIWPRYSQSTTTHTVPPTVSSSTLSPRQRLLNSRLRSPSQRQFVRPPYRQGILSLFY